jgi:hypothetical protein
MRAKDRQKKTTIKYRLWDDLTQLPHNDASDGCTEAQGSGSFWACGGGGGEGRDVGGGSSSSRGREAGGRLAEEERPNSGLL